MVGLERQAGAKAKRSGSHWEVLNRCVFVCETHSRLGTGKGPWLWCGRHI